MEKVCGDIVEVPHVKSIHHVHIWAISTTEIALTAHVVVDDISVMGDIKKDVRTRLDGDGISHATLEFEAPGEECCCRCDC